MVKLNKMSKFYCVIIAELLADKWLRQIKLKIEWNRWMKIISLILNCKSLIIFSNKQNTLECENTPKTQ